MIPVVEQAGETYESRDILVSSIQADPDTLQLLRSTGAVGVEVTDDGVGVGAFPNVDFHVVGLDNGSGAPSKGLPDWWHAMFTNSNTAYGLMMAVRSSGDVWIQACRRSGGNTDYPIIINPLGNILCVGNTDPRNWSHSSFTAIQLGSGAGWLGNAVGGNDNYFSTNAYYNGNWNRIANGEAMRVSHFRTRIQWDLADYGTANSAITTWPYFAGIDVNGFHGRSLRMSNDYVAPLQPYTLLGKNTNHQDSPGSGYAALYVWGGDWYAVNGQNERTRLTGAETAVYQKTAGDVEFPAGANAQIPFQYALGDSTDWNVVGGDLVAARDHPHIVRLEALLGCMISATGNNQEINLAVQWQVTTSTGDSYVQNAAFPFATPRSGTFYISLTCRALVRLKTGDTVRLNAIKNLSDSANGYVQECDLWSDN